MRFVIALIICLIGVAMFGIGIWSQYQMPDLYWVAAFVVVVFGLWFLTRE